MDDKERGKEFEGDKRTVPKNPIGLVFVVVLFAVFCYFFLRVILAIIGAFFLWGIFKPFISQSRPGQNNPSG